MRWFKIAAIAGGLIIAFLVVGSVVHFIMAAVTTIVIAALVVGGIAVAIKMARSGKQVSGKRRAQTCSRTRPRCRPSSRLAVRRSRRTSTTNWPASSARWVTSASWCR